MASGTRDARLLYHAGAIRIAQGDVSGREMVRKAISLQPAFDAVGGPEAAKLVNANATASR